MQIRVTTPPAGVIALRALRAKWRQATQIRLHPLIAGVEPGNDPDADGFEKLGLSEQAIFKHCADDLDALVARVEPQEGTLHEFAGLPVTHQGFAGLPDQLYPNTLHSYRAAARVAPHETVVMESIQLPDID